MANCNENCWVLTGDYKDDLWWAEISDKTSGSPCSVEFDYKMVLEREEKGVQTTRGWLHTHPGMSAVPSSRDDATMHAWVLALGRPLVCCIAGNDGLRAWWYLDDEKSPVEYQVYRMGDVFFGLTPDEFFESKELPDADKKENTLLKFLTEVKDILYIRYQEKNIDWENEDLIACQGMLLEIMKQCSAWEDQCIFGYKNNEE